MHIARNFDCRMESAKKFRKEGGTIGLRACERFKECTTYVILLIQSRGEERSLSIDVKHLQARQLRASVGDDDG
jgi:hypothetical protein